MSKELERQAEKEAYIVDFHLVQYKNQRKNDLNYFLLLDFDSQVKRCQSTVELYQSRLIPLFEIQHMHCREPTLTVEDSKPPKDYSNLCSLAFFTRNDIENSDITWSFGPYGQVSAGYKIKGKGLFSYSLAHLVQRSRSKLKKHNLKQERTVSLSEVDARNETDLKSRNNFYIRAGFKLYDSDGNCSPELTSGKGVAAFNDLSIDALKIENITIIENSKKLISPFKQKNQDLFSKNIGFSELIDLIDIEAIQKLGMYFTDKECIDRKSTRLNSSH